MATGWGDRIGQGFLVWQSRMRRRVTLDEVGEAIARAEKRRDPYSKATVSGWMGERNEPTIRTFEAIAAVFGGDPWWYVWNVGRAPDNPIFDGIAQAPRSHGKGRKASGDD